MTDGTPALKGFNRFFSTFLQYLRQWLFFVLYLAFFLLLFILAFRGRIGSSAAGTDVLLTLLNGLRFDSMVVTNWLIIPLLASMTPLAWRPDRFAGTIRRIWDTAF